MEANTRQLEAIFDPNVFFQVPLFQRPYVWQEGDNWEPLWEDIHSLLDRSLRTGKSKPHFLGAVVLEQIPNPAGSIETRLVIDGQQRFTTLQLFLIAARNLADAAGAQKISSRFSGLVENDEGRVEQPQEKFKLWPTNSDRLAFKIVHGSTSLDGLAQALKAKPALASSNLVGAYRYFHGKLSAWLAGSIDEDDEDGTLAGKSVADRFDALWQVVKSGIQLVVINLDKDDETQVIFETLNARGTELLPADLIKNYLFRRAQAEMADVEELYHEHWERFETEHWRQAVKQGRVTRPRIDLFINHYLTLMTRDEVRTTHLFNAFKDFVESDSEGNPSTAAEHVRQLAEYADIFVALNEPDDHPALALFLRRLAAVDTATVFPFLMLAYAQLMPERKAEFDRVVAVIESFLMRRLITGATSKNYNRFFVDLIKAMERAGGVTHAAVVEHLARGSGDSTRFPTNEELRAALVGQPIYNRMAKYKIHAVLEALDSIAHTSKSETLAMPSNLTIEHVMPQGWERHWPLPAGLDPAAEHRAIAKRQLLLHSLGNLTLITGSFNSSLQNAAWSAKRPELLKFAKLNLTQYFHDACANEWNEEAIDRRTEHLLGHLYKVWPNVSRPTLVSAAEPASVTSGDGA